MTVSSSVLRTHFDYTNWATNRLLRQAALLPDEYLNRDFATADKNIVQTLAHIYLVDRVWLGRVEYAPVAFGNPGDFSLSDLEAAWPMLQNRWTVFLTAQTDHSVNERITYLALQDQEFSQPLWQLLLHIVNHATHHRGQVTGFLRSLGYTPEPIDLITYYRQLPPADL
jgi:uncharacterized damage-inducible protein DinB